MTLKEIVDGLQFTLDMFLFDPTTGETYPEPRNDMDKITIDACKGAIELLEKQPCEDCISREQAVYVASGYCEPQNIADELRKLPSVTPQPKRGKWIELKNTHGTTIALRCPICKKSPMRGIRSDFCPSCGADMREVQADYVS